MDQGTTIQQLRDILKKFRDERDWEQFHNPKDLAMAISVEVGEFLEKFLWESKEEVIKKLKEDKQYQKEVAEELSDIVNY